MQGGEEEGAEYQPQISLENPEEPTQTAQTQVTGAALPHSPENEIDMQEGASRVWRQPQQQQIEEKRGDKARFTRYPACEL